MAASQCGCDLALSVEEGARLHALMYSNEPPEESELPLVQSAASQTDARSAIIDEEIAKLRETLKQLEEDRASLLSYKVILSPLRRIPPEVLGQIFSWTLPSVDDEWCRTKWDATYTDSPWNLTEASGLSRAVSLSAPLLWSRFAINYTPAQDPLSAYPLAMVDAQIRRSGSQKLSIHFYGCETVESGPQTEVFYLLAEHSERWEELGIGISAGMVSLLTNFDHRVPSLRRLWINWASPDSQMNVQSINSFQSASSLVDVGIYHDYRFVSIPFPAHRLTRYQLDGPWVTHDDLLRMAPNLIEARIMVHFDQQPWPPSPATIELKHLRRLYVSAWEFLPHLATPALQKLALWMEEDDHLNVPACLETFFTRTTRQLCSLALRGTPDAQITSVILQRIPCITDLSIAIDYANDRSQIETLLWILTIAPGRTVTAPHLRSLSFGCEYESYVDYPRCLEMLRSRWEADSCALTTATLAVEGPRQPLSTTLDGLHALRREGLDLSILQGDEAGRTIRDWFFTWRY